MTHTREWLQGAIAALDKVALFRIPALPPAAAAVVRHNPEGAMRAAVDGILSGAAQLAGLYRSDLAALPERQIYRDKELSAEEKAAWSEAGRAVAAYIDDNGLTCDCCQHVMIDVTAAKSGQEQHCIAGDPEGDGSGCIVGFRKDQDDRDLRTEATIAELREQVESLTKERDAARFAHHWVKADDTIDVEYCLRCETIHTQHTERKPCGGVKP